MTIAIWSKGSIFVKKFMSGKGNSLIVDETAECYNRFHARKNRGNSYERTKKYGFNISKVI